MGPIGLTFVKNYWWGVWPSCQMMKKCYWPIWAPKSGKHFRPQFFFFQNGPLLFFCLKKVTNIEIVTHPFLVHLFKNALEVFHKDIAVCKSRQKWVFFNWLLLGLLATSHTREWRSRTKIRRNFWFRPVSPGFGFVRPFLPDFVRFALFLPKNACFCLFLPSFARFARFVRFRPNLPEFVRFRSSCACAVRYPLVHISTVQYWTTTLLLLPSNSANGFPVISGLFPLISMKVHQSILRKQFNFNAFRCQNFL